MKGVKIAGGLDEICTPTASSTVPKGAKPSRKVSSVVCHASPLDTMSEACHWAVKRPVPAYPMKSFAMFIDGKREKGSRRQAICLVCFTVSFSSDMVRLGETASCG
jgi:hypothetical protein